MLLERHVHASLANLFRKASLEIKYNSTPDTVGFQDQWVDIINPFEIVTWFLGFCVQPIHKKVTSGFQGIRYARVPMARLKPATEEYFGRNYHRLCRQRVENVSIR
ncbi:hypothetical protein PoB_000228700 [Plakobranchus ocellatus]|uniref:Uncharacterized protein n=1 Tax=Plakobranchus ocellatus TaxID=259542 RepID=A0AAV3XZ74_9GAST|nr:hypothetical protein PoB_000228700 [Plakobranchus ocellatus]